MLKAWKIGSGSSLFPLLWWLLFPPWAHATTAPEQIRATLHHHLEQRVDQWQRSHPGQWLGSSIKVQLPSGATHLAPCQVPIELEGGKPGFPGGRQHRRLSCQQPGWSLLVRAEVALSARVPVAKRKLRAGDLIAAGHLRWQTRQLTPADDDLLLAIAEITGQRARRGIRAGSPIRAQQLLPPLMVERGQQVVIRAVGETFSATTSGVAMEDGSLGEVIRVKNQRSGKFVSATVVEKGKVETNF